MAITLTQAPEGLTVSAGTVTETIHATTADGTVHLTPQAAEQLSRALLRLAGQDTPAVHAEPQPEAPAAEPDAEPAKPKRSHHRAKS